MSSDEIDRACWRFVNDPDLKPLRDWWENAVVRTAASPPLDPLVLAWREGDKYRWLAIQHRAKRFELKDRNQG